MTSAHPVELDPAWGVVAAAPVCSLRFTLGAFPAVNVVPTQGTLTWDESAWPRTELSVELPTTITPSTLPAAISAYGGRVVVTMGATWGGRTHTFTAATLAVASVAIDRPSARITITATSFEALVNEDRYGAETLTVAGSVSAVVAGIVHRTIPGCAVSNQLGALDVALPAGAYSLDGDVWPTVETIMTTAGAEAWFDALGVLVLRPSPVKGVPTLTIATGARGALTGYASNRVWGPNVVALSYVTDDTPPKRLQGTWTDNRPASATYTGGPYGRHTDRETLSVKILPTQAVANAAAAAKATRIVGRLRTVTARAVPAPWLLPGDTVTLALLGGVTEDHVISALTLPLPGLDVMNLTTRDSDYTGGPF